MAGGAGGRDFPAGLPAAGEAVEGEGAGDMSEKATLDIICCSEREALPLDGEALKKDYCEYEDICPLGELRMQLRVAKGVLARAICVCGTDEVGLVRYEKT